MTLLLIGLLLWAGVHLMKRVAPGLHAKLGEKPQGKVAGLLLVSIVLMVIGYRSADLPVYWGRDAMTVGINNLLVLLGFYFFAASGAKTRVTQYTRHPQLIGFSLWAIGHLVVNGDMASFILFGGLLLWAWVEMAVISAQEGPYDPPPKAPIGKEVLAIVLSVILFSIVAGVHTLLGYFPFGA